MNIISKIGIAQFNTATPKSSDPTSPALTPSSKNRHDVPAFSASALNVPGSMDSATMGLNEHQLKRQGLECLVAVLRSLVAWGITPNKTTSDLGVDMVRTNSKDEFRRGDTTPEPTTERSMASASSTEILRQATPDLVDDPMRFENAKQKKTTLLEGIKKFNFKPKRVRVSFLDVVLKDKLIVCIGDQVLR